MHDLKIEYASSSPIWVYAWCPCGWKTDVIWNPSAYVTDDLKRRFHEHLGTAQSDGSQEGRTDG